MKKTILSFVSCFTCLAFLISPICCGADSVVSDVLSDTIYQVALNGDEIDTNPFANLNEKVASLAWEYALSYATLSNNQIQLKYPTWDVITGKCTNEVTFLDGGTYTYTVDVSGVFCEADMASLWNYASESTGGSQVYANCLNVTITKPSGVTQYVIEMPSSWSYSSKYAVSSGGVSININTYCKLYGYNNGRRVLMDSNFYVASINYSTVTVNSVVNNSNVFAPAPNNYKPDPVGIYSTTGSAVSSSGALRYPLDVDILHNGYMLKYNHNTTSSSTGVTFRPLQHLYVSYVTTNVSSHGNTLDNYWTDNSKKNYYIYPTTGGTVINNTNYNDYSGGLAPVFSLDTSLPDVLDILKDIIPSILDLMLPEIDMDIGDLLGKLLDFFGSMPDIDMPWNVDPSLNINNYNDLQLPDINLPDSGGGSGGDVNVIVTVTVDVNVTRPLVTVYSYEDPISLNTLPEITTYTMPVAVRSAAGEVLEQGSDLMDDLGLLPIFAFLTLVGIASALIFKGV